MEAWVMPLLYFPISLLLMGLAVPLMRRRVAPNSLYGLRVKATFASERVWYEANAASARDLLAIGVLLFVFTLAMVIAQAPALSQAIVLTTLLTVGCVVSCYRGVRLANRLLAEEQGRG